MDEIWKDIDNYNDYKISNFGRIKSFKYDKMNGIILEFNDNKGYLHITLYQNKNPKTKRIHILLYETFNNYKLKKNECIHHKDKNKLNNYIDNLELMTKSEHNSLHHKNKKIGSNNPMFGKHRYGSENPMFGKKHSKKSKKLMSQKRSIKLGENSSHSILKNQDIIQIRILLEEGILTQKEIAKKFNVDRTTISAIKNKKLWRHI